MLHYWSLKVNSWKALLCKLLSRHVTNYHDVNNWSFITDVFNLEEIFCQLVNIHCMISQVESLFVIFEKYCVMPLYA